MQTTMTYVNSTTVTLGTAATNSVSGTTAIFGTDDTSAFNALLSTVHSAGGGDIVVDGHSLILGQITLPNNGGSYPAGFTQNPIRILGHGPSANAYWNGTIQSIPEPSSSLDLQYNATYAKIITLGLGYLEIGNLGLLDGGSDCAPFFLTTNTTVYLHDLLMQGTEPQYSACNTGVIAGGTSSSAGTSPVDGFQGYPIVIERVVWDKIQYAFHSQVGANAAFLAFDTVTANSGNSGGAGEAILISGTDGQGGDSIGPILLELNNYNIGIHVTSGAEYNTFPGNTLNDSSVAKCYQFDSGTQFNMVLGGYCSNLTAPIADLEGNNFSIINGQFFSSVGMTQGGYLSAGQAISWLGGHRTNLGGDAIQSPQFYDPTNFLFDLDDGGGGLSLGTTAGGIQFSTGTSAFASKDAFFNRIAAKSMGAGTVQGGVDATVQAGVTATDPGCTTTAHIGKQWFNITTTTTTYSVCLNTSGTVGWVQVKP